MLCDNLAVSIAMIISLMVCPIAFNVLIVCFILYYSFVCSLLLFHI